MHNAALQLPPCGTIRSSAYGHSMRRRDFISLLSSAVTSWPLAARAQQPTKVPLLGYLTGDFVSADLPRRNAFQQGLRDLGYNEGQNIFVECRTAAGSVDRLSEIADEFARLNVDVIFAFSTAAVQVVAKAMPTKPIVSITPDPVLAGLVANLARPGGNITGLSTLAGVEIYRKYPELLKDVVPNLTRVALLLNPTNPFGAPLALKETEAAAVPLRLSI